MTSIDPFVLGQITSGAIAILALAGVTLLKSARLRSWCACKLDELKKTMWDESRDDEHLHCCRAHDEIAALQERVRRLEELCQELAAENDHDGETIDLPGPDAKRVA